jgi:hypothetical protein
MYPPIFNLMIQEQEIRVFCIKVPRALDVKEVACWSARIIQQFSRRDRLELESIDSRTIFTVLLHKGITQDRIDEQASRIKRALKREFGGEVEVFAGTELDEVLADLAATTATTKFR